MKKRFLILLYILIFLFHISLLYAISILVKERKISPKDFKDMNVQIEFTNVKKHFKPQEKKIIEKKTIVAEGTKDETDDKKETETEDDISVQGADYPVFPENKIRARLEYPEEASEQGIEDYVVLELFIDKDGYIKEVVATRDPGHGFAKSAVKAFKGLKCIPAKMDGIPIAVKIRKTVRFVLK